MTPDPNSRAVSGAPVVLATFVSTRGGVWRHVRDLATGLRNRRIPVTIALPGNADLLRGESEALGIPVIPVDSWVPKSYESCGLVVHIHLANSFDIAGLRLALMSRLRGHRVVITEHLPRTNASDHRLAGGSPSQLARWSKSLFKFVEFLAAHQVIAVSEGSREFLCERYRVQPSKVLAVPNGVDADAIEFAAEVNAGTHEPARYVVAGSLIQQKGMDVLVAACHLADRDWTVDVYGDGTHRQRLEEQARGGLDTEPRVRFHGWSGEVAEAINASDGLVVPSRWEASSYSTLEAMAAGKAVVGTRIDGVAQIIVDAADPEQACPPTGLLVPPGDAAALASALDDLSVSRERRAAMGWAGRARVKSLFTLEAMVDSTVAAYGDHVAGPTRLVISPNAGGIRWVADGVATEWQRRGEQVRRLYVHDDGVVECPSSSRFGRESNPANGPSALRAVAEAWRHRPCCGSLRGSTHVEIGRRSGTTFWFVLASTVAWRRSLVLAAHDMPIVVRHPAALIVPRGHRVMSAFAYRILAPTFDRGLLMLLRRRTTGTIVLSNDAQASAKKAGWRHVMKATLGADPASESLTDPARASIVLLAGYLGPGKGLDVFAEAWAMVGDCAPEMTLIIAGAASSEQDRAWVEPIAQRLNAGSRPPTWLGHVSDSEFSRVIAQSAVLVLPYEASNPASGPLVQALVAGRPVVATRVAAVVDELVDGVSGLLCDPGDAVGLAACLRRVMSEPELRTVLGRGAVARGRAHSWSGQVDVVAAAHGAATVDDCSSDATATA